MPDVAHAIDTYAETVTHQARETGAYATTGRATEGLAEPASLQAAVFPADGDTLKDLPEGERSEVSLTMFSRSAVSKDDRITRFGTHYRVLKVADWRQGAFFQAWLRSEA